MRRLSAPLIALLAAALLALLPASASAAGVSWYRLTNTDMPGAAPVQEVLARIIPPGSIIPPDPKTSPLTILPDSTGYVSSGFDSKELEVLLGDGQTPEGDPFQVMKLDFGPNGFQPGGRLYFSLNRSPAFDGLTQLVLPSSVQNLAFESLAVTDVPTDTGGGSGSGGGGGSVPPAQVPEPMSLVLWSAVLALGLVRARAYRRTHQPATV